jgi:hypothetical protein
MAATSTLFPYPVSPPPRRHREHRHLDEREWLDSMSSAIASHASLTCLPALAVLLEPGEEILYSVA